jgi:hypothetical protein
MKNNPQAFPTPGVFDPTLPQFHKPVEGATLLDYFAGQVISSYNGRSMIHYTDMAKLAYNVAEAMLAEREKRIK